MMKLVRIAVLQPVDGGNVDELVVELEEPGERLVLTLGFYHGWNAKICGEMLHSLARMVEGGGTFAAVGDAFVRVGRVTDG